MGKRSSNRRNAAAMLDSDDTDSVSSSSSVRSDMISVGYAPEIDKDTLVDQALDALFEKRGSTREKALASIIEAFSTNLQYEFVEKKFATLLHQCVNSIKRGSSKEISLASHAIGLLALTTGCGISAREILDESVPSISQALRLKSESSKVASLLECLAVITFIGGEDPEETERSMQIMWQVVHPKLGTNMVASKPSPAVITAMVSAWSFLLTTVDAWALSLKDWQESISYLSTLLDKDDRSVRIAAGEALAVIFEVGDFERFFGEGKASSGSADSKTREGYLHLKGLKGKVLNQVRDLAAEAGGKGAAKKDLNNQRNLFRDLLDFLEDGYAPETSVKIGGDSLNTTSWSQLIRLNFMRHFLRGGFVKHMLENEFLHDVFGFVPKKKMSLGIEDQSLNKFNEKRLYKSPNSALAKARTQYLNKQRMMLQDRKAGHFAVACDEE
uniref:Interferon-related developmental regulator family protein n=1 Tax=Sesuvium portulacastrum TaxID=221166 RepID=A0A2I7ZAN5_SESPO|nr:interferon-related developmental regulator family protein [Sesuvium portulacastrum]